MPKPPKIESKPEVKRLRRSAKSILTQARNNRAVLEAYVKGEINAARRAQLRCYIDICNRYIEAYEKVLITLGKIDRLDNLTVVVGTNLQT
jgi:hypothetical protein